MTLSERNAFFKIGMVFCAIVTLLVIGVSFITIPIYPLMEENTRQPSSFFQYITGIFLKTDYLAVHASIILAVLFSLISMILIHSFFERTSAQEILYISFFTFSFSFEILRLIIPAHLLANFPMIYPVTASRILLFTRHFALFSLFAGSLCAAGQDIQRTRNVILCIFIPSFIISMGVIADAQIWDTSFNLAYGHLSILKMIETIGVIAIITNFIVAVKVRNSKEYFYLGLGAAITLAGRAMLIGADNWAAPAAGILFLSFGIWFMCSKLHKIHLWL